MKIQLFSLFKENDIIQENLGVSRLYAFLKAHDLDVTATKLFCNKSIDAELAKIDFSCQLFGFSAYQDNIDFVIELCKRIKEKTAAIIWLGSKFAGTYAEILLADIPYIDFIVLGDGEFPLLDVFSKLASGYSMETIANENKHIMTHANMQGKSICNSDIASLPWPDRSHLQGGKDFLVHICDSHGCVSNCSFCGQSGKWTGRTAQDIFNEIITIYEKTGIRMFSFTGASFEAPGALGKKRIRELCGLLKSYPVNFSFGFFIRAESFQNNLEDKALLALMKDAGFHDAFIGIEAGNEEDLLLYKKRATLEDNHKIFGLLKDADINTSQFGFIMLNPYSTLERLRKNYMFLKKQRCFYLSRFISHMSVHYNTPIYHKLKKDGLLKEDYSIYNMTAYNFVDKKAEDIFDLLNEKISSAPVLIASGDNKVYNFMNLFILAKHIVNVQDLIPQVYQTLQSIESHCNSFFYHVYVENDLALCTSLFPSFLHNLDECYQKFDVYYAKLLIRLMEEKLG